MSTNHPATWRLLPLEECMDAIIDYRGKTPEKRSFGIPLITAKIVKGGRILRAEEFIDPEGYVAWMRRGYPKRGDVLMTTEAPLGEVAQLEDDRCALAQRIICLRGKDSLLDNGFLRYLLQSPYVQEQLHARATGTTVLGIRQRELRQILLPLPPLEEQIKIASILAVLDEKIETNRYTNETLEAMAQALFKSWFIDFDPVRAKMDGGQPVGMDAIVAALFPNSMETSDLGQIPRGWRHGCLGDVIDILDARRIPLSSRERETRRGSYPYYGAAGVVDHVDAHIFEGPHVLLGEDGSVVREDGSAFVQYVWGQFWVNNHAHVLQGRGITCEHLLQIARFLNVAPFVTGAVQPKLNQLNLRSIPLILPPESIANQFGNILDPWYAVFRTNVEEISMLTDLRDQLLPRLSSGELRVRDASASQ